MGGETRPVPQVRSVQPGGRVGDPSPDETLDVDRPDGPLGQAVLQATRLRLLALLSSEAAHVRGGYSLHDLGELLACSAQNVHHHLRVLVDTGAVYLVRSDGANHVARQYWCSDVRRVRVHVPAKGLRSVLDVDLLAQPELTEVESRLLSRDGADTSELRMLVHAGVIRALERLPPDERAALGALLNAESAVVGREREPR